VRRARRRRRDAHGRRVARSQQQVADVFANAGLLPRHVDVRPLWDDRFNPFIIKEA